MQRDDAKQTDWREDTETLGKIAEDIMRLEREALERFNKFATSKGHKPSTRSLRSKEEIISALLGEDESKA